MLAMIGAFLGWKLVLVTLVLSSVAGSLIGLSVIVQRKGGMKYALPYGTFLALGALVASLAGDAIVNWYVGMY
jgi:leader peptidase (prepilin peptidase)/N-methyltransferase